MESMSKSVMRSELRKAELGLLLIVTVINFQPSLTYLLFSEYSLIPMSYPLGYRAKAFKALGSDLGGVGTGTKTARTEGGGVCHEVKLGLIFPLHCFLFCRSNIISSPGPGRVRRGPR